jgi:hypothetical protein
MDRRARGRSAYSPGVRSRSAIFCACFALLVVVAVGAASRDPKRPRVVVSVDLSHTWRVTRLQVGVTHTQHSLDPWGDPAAVRRGKRLVRRASTLQNQAIYGWGTRNPNPAPGVYDWRTLDRRIALIRSMGAQPVITLCCAPDWMTGDGTGSRYPKKPPTPDHYDDFAALARRIALRYPDVRHYVVWNEMKGFWDRSARNWDYRAYTEMYNRVWTALKSVNPHIRVGGPYLVLEGTGSTRLGKRGRATRAPITPRNREVLGFWLRHKRGASFLAIDRKTVSRSHDRNAYTPAEQLRLTRRFRDVTKQLRRLTRLPVWYVEDYFVGHSDWRLQRAGLASMLYWHVRSGVAVSLRWGPQGTRGGPFGGNEQSLFSDTRYRGGGVPFPAYGVYRAIHDHFAPGTRLYHTSSSSRRLLALASRRRTLLVNQRPVPVRVVVRPGGRVLVPAYGFRVVRSP